jgi:hypothetical protein
MDKEADKKVKMEEEKNDWQRGEGEIKKRRQ